MGLKKHGRRTRVAWVVTVASSIVLVALIGGWVASCWWGIELVLAEEHTHAVQTFGLSRGSIRYAAMDNTPGGGLLRDEFGFVAVRIYDEPPDRSGSCAFGRLSWRSGGWSGWREICVPVWFGVLFVAVVNVLSVRRLIRGQRVDPSKCEHCGYQLLAEQGRCPECGFVVNSAIGAR